MKGIKSIKETGKDGKVWSVFKILSLALVSYIGAVILVNAFMGFLFFDFFYVLYSLVYFPECLFWAGIFGYLLYAGVLTAIVLVRHKKKVFATLVILYMGLLFMNIFCYVTGRYSKAFFYQIYDALNDMLIF